MSLNSPAIEYLAERPTPEEFELLFRSSGWTEALAVPADRLAASLPHAWHAVCARRGGQIVGAGLVLNRAPSRAGVSRALREMFRYRPQK